MRTEESIKNTVISDARRAVAQSKCEGINLRGWICGEEFWREIERQVEIVIKRVEQQGKYDVVRSTSYVLNDLPVQISRYVIPDVALLMSDEGIIVRVVKLGEDQCPMMQ